MYSTAKEIHIAIQSQLNQINSNRKHTFRPEEIDAVFNSTMLAFIEERAIVNEGDVGLTETVKRYDDLRDLNVIDEIVSTYLIMRGGKPYKQLCILPTDYYKYERLDLLIDYDCYRKEGELDYIQPPFTLFTLEFKTPNDATDFNDIIIYFNGDPIYDIKDYKLDNLKNPQSKFMIVNNILNVLNPLIPVGINMEVYWEDFNNFHIPNTFIFKVNDINLVSNIISMEYGGTTIDSDVLPMGDMAIVDTTYLDKDTRVPTELIASKDLSKAKDNYYMYKNRYKEPFIQLTKTSIDIDFQHTYPVKEAYLTYIKHPILINLKADIMTDFKSHIREIIDLTVATLSLTLTGQAEAYTSLANKNTQ